MRTNFVLIDYENVHLEALTGLDAEHFKILLFVGANQTKLPFELAAAVQKLGNRAEYVKISGNGSNALDFHIAFYVGQLAAQDPKAYYHIISKDKGFDPLIQHLRSRKISIARSSSIADIPLLKASNAKTATEKLDVIVANLKQRKTGKPRTIKTLSSTINSLFQKQLADDELASLLAEMQGKGWIIFNENKVSYALG
ncbi:PIN domain-containing protein [Desulfomicrobium sp. ZS1]|uniref:PIN domain-containing protein n=1 Tax=Desulfomicrobium sp. ZS1 TaxID=2952228 RepID=UPI0020B26B57|nr:PIN domain-containing protein [Desulfomicrobium sp. ZS1]UTF51795.1 PIN domain-containing protein [Desulfomicrobium sp. ZS1]